MTPRLRELAPVARGSQEAGFTQPRAHSFAQPCTVVSESYLTNMVRQDVLQECLVDYLDVDGLLLLGFELPLPLVVGTW